jgi:uncharacterized protein YraI
LQYELGLEQTMRLPTMQLKQFALAAGVVLLSAGSAAAALVTNDLNLRSGPSTRYGVIDTMPAGAQVSILSCTGSWCRVSWRGEVGYASRSYLSGSGYASNGYYAEPYSTPYYSYDYGYPGYYDYSYGPGFYFGRGYHRYHHRGRHIGRGDHHGRGHHHVAGGSGGHHFSGRTMGRSRGTVGMGGGGPSAPSSGGLGGGSSSHGGGGHGSGGFGRH